MSGLMGDRFLKWLVGNLLHRSKSNPPDTAGIKPEHIDETVNKPVGHKAEVDREREESENLEPKETINTGNGRHE